jgi:hypothetical protein
MKESVSLNASLSKHNAIYIFAHAAGLDKLAALEFLDLRANQISNIDDIASIASVSQ